MADSRERYEAGGLHPAVLQGGALSPETITSKLREGYVIHLTPPSGSVPDRDNSALLVSHSGQISRTGKPTDECPACESDSPGRWPNAYLQADGTYEPCDDPWHDEEAA